MDLMALGKLCKKSKQDAPSQESAVCVPLPVVLPLCSFVLMEMNPQWPGGPSVISLGAVKTGY